jgi:hypothetical protein
MLRKGREGAKVIVRGTAVGDNREIGWWVGWEGE